MGKLERITKTKKQNKKYLSSCLVIFFGIFKYLY